MHKPQGQFAKHKAQARTQAILYGIVLFVMLVAMLACGNEVAVMR